MVDNTWHELIYSFHMPMFFIISGFLFKIRTPIETTKRAFSSLFVPYLLFNGLLLIYNIIYLVYKGSLSCESIVSRIIPILLGLGYNTNDLHPVCTPMWFFYSLFMLQVIVSLFARWKHGLLYLFSLCIVFCCIKRYVGFDTLIPIDSTLIAIPFFLLGYWAKDFLVRFSDQKYAIFIAFLCLLLGMCISKYNGRVDMNTCKLGKSIFGFYAIAGLYLLHC